MAKLTGQTIADSYDQLLIVDGANGITSSLQAVESADTGGSSSALSISTVAISVAGNATITTADNSDTLTLISTDVDADSGPNLRMYRNSGSPAQNDIAGQIEFQGRNNNSQDVAYGQIYSKIETVTDGSEDGDMKFSTMKGGTLRDRLNIHTTATVFNEDHEDVDFRVESDTITHALFVQGSDGNVGIGGSPSTDLYVLRTDSDSEILASVTGPYFPRLQLERTSGESKTNRKWSFDIGSNGSLFVEDKTGGNSLMEFDASNDVTVTTGDLIFGTAGKGICLGVTSNTDSNTLDDYEEGTYTLTIVGSTSGSMTMDTYKTFKYTKIGNTCHVQGYYGVTADASISGTLRFLLPFTTSTGSGADADYGVGTMTMRSGGGTNQYNIVAQWSGNVQYFILRFDDGDQSSSLMDEGDVGASPSGWVGFTYNTAT